jgi:prophage regulatory protein
METATQPKLIRPDVVMERTGIRSHTHLKKMVMAGQFPVPVQLGPKSIAFVESEIENWISARIASRQAHPAPADMGSVAA